jgi:hypothetical protein
MLEVRGVGWIKRNETDRYLECMRKCILVDAIGVRRWNRHPDEPSNITVECERKEK